MLREYTKLINYFRLVLDIGLTYASFILAYQLRASLSFLNDSYGPLMPMQEYNWLLMFIIPLSVLLLNYFELYGSMRKETYLDILIKVIKPFSVMVLLAGALVYVLKIGEDVSRTFLFGFIFINFFVILSEQLSEKIFFTFMRRRGFNYRTMLIVGSDKTALDFSKLLQQHRGWGIKIIGFVHVDDIANTPPPGMEDIRMLGSLKDLPDILDRHIVDEVLFSVPLNVLESIQDVALKCETLGITVHIKADFINVIISETKLQDFYGVPILTFSPTPQNAATLFMKRCFDILLSICLMFAMAPVMFITAVLIKSGSKGPVIYRQRRFGLNKRPFTLYKFRSMNEDADEMMDEVAHLNEMSGPVFKAENDPRMTKVGRLIRKLSIDELPQLWNVFKGDMSIVGPRPPLPAEVAQYENWQKRRLSMKPGLTCLWQVSGRNNVDFEDWMKLDLQYIDNWSLGLDLKIMLMTIPVVLLARGAK